MGVFRVGGQRNFVLRDIYLRDFYFMKLRKADVSAELV